MEMIENLPSDNEYSRYNAVYKNRYIHPCNYGIWEEVSNALKALHPENKTRVQLLRDFPGYAIGPHTDGQKELYTYLFYLTNKEVPDEGTTIYIPRDNFKSDGTQHFKVSNFIKYKKVPFSPNAGFVFLRSDNSFHGVEETKSTRNLIQLSVYK